MTTRTWKVYGKAGDNQSASYTPSALFVFNRENMVVAMDVLNADITGTHEYSIVRIMCKTLCLDYGEKEEFRACKGELRGQLLDGYFENYPHGRVVEIKDERK